MLKTWLTCFEFALIVIANVFFVSKPSERMQCVRLTSLTDTVMITSSYEWSGLPPGRIERRVLLVLGYSISLNFMRDCFFFPLPIPSADERAERS